MTKKSDDFDFEIYNDEQQFWANVKAQADLAIEKMRGDYKVLKAQSEMAEAKIAEFRE